MKMSRIAVKRMKMTAMALALAPGMGIEAMASDAVDGAALFVNHCGACHGQSAGQSPEDRSAPPMVAVKDHYIRALADKEAFVAAVAGWIREQSEDKTLMPGAIRRFGIMPPLELSEEDAIAIAEFVFDEKMEQPDWYAKHYNDNHGPNGKQGKMGNNQPPGAGLQQ